MRKRSTFEELASATLVKQKINTSPLPYEPPHDNTFAIMELRNLMDKLRQDTENAEEARHAEARAARDMGVTPEHLRQMMEGITTAGSRMHEQTRKQAQDFDAASQRRTQLMFDQYLRDQAANRRAAEQQQRAAEEIKSSLRGTTSSSSAAAAAAQEGMRGPAAAATPPGGFQTPQGAAPGTPADKFAQAFPQDDPTAGLGAAAAAAAGYDDPSTEEKAAAAELTRRFDDTSSTTYQPITHKPKSNLGPKEANKEALKQYRLGAEAARLKQVREAQKQATTTGQSEDSAGKKDSVGATSSATGQLAASELTEGGASSSGGAQVKLDEYGPENDASKARRDRKSGTQAAGSGGAGSGKGKTRTTRSRRRSRGDGQTTLNPTRTAQSDDTESPSVATERGRSPHRGVVLKPARSRSKRAVEAKDL